MALITLLQASSEFHFKYRQLYNAYINDIRITTKLIKIVFLIKSNNLLVKIRQHNQTIEIGSNDQSLAQAKPSMLVKMALEKINLKTEETSSRNKSTKIASTINH